MASENVNAVYANRANRGKATVLRKVRLKRIEAHRTIPVDRRAPAVVEKADADLKQQQVEMGEANDDQSNVPPQADAGSEADRSEAVSPEPASVEAKPAPKRKLFTRKKA